MRDDANFVGNIPEHYDRVLGPIIFGDYAADICAPSGGVQSGARAGDCSRYRDCYAPVARSFARWRPFDGH